MITKQTRNGSLLEGKCTRLKMPAKLCVLILVSLLCCEFSDENRLEASSENKKQNQGDSEVENDEFVSSVEDDNEEATALKLVPAPDLTKEKERKKGNKIFTY